MDTTLTIVDQVRDHARYTPDLLAVRFGDHTLSFSELDRRSNGVARALMAADVGRQARVAVLAKNTPTFYELALGAFKANIVLVPINYRLASTEIAHVLHDSQAEFLFVASDFVETVSRIREDLPHLRDMITIDGPDYPCTGYTSWRDRHGTGAPDVPVTADSVAVQMYTSGTTGRPKGALLSHANLSEALRGALPSWGPWFDYDKILVCMPQYHIGASIWGLGGLWQGIESVLTREFNAPEILDIISRFRITKTQFASVMMKMLIEHPACASTDFSSLSLIIYGTAPAPLSLIELAQKTFGCGIAQGYGMTETAGAISYLTVEDHAHPVGNRIKSAGRAMLGVDIRICGPNGEVLPANTVGEVTCCGSQVMQGYWRLPEATAEALRHGWLHTGDAGYLDEDGYLFICDRLKDMIVSGGENIYPAEIEDALHAHPDVADVAVIGVPDERWGEVAKAIVVLRSGRSLAEEELLFFVRDRIARFKVPRSVEFVDALPRNTSGKILKHELRRPYWQGRATALV